MQLLSFCVLGLGDLNIIKGSVAKCISLACTRARYLFARNWEKKKSQQAHSWRMVDIALIQESPGTDIFLDMDNIMDFGEHIKSPPCDLVAALDVNYTTLDWYVKDLTISVCSISNLWVKCWVTFFSFGLMANCAVLCNSFLKACK